MKHTLFRQFERTGITYAIDVYNIQAIAQEVPRVSTQVFDIVVLISWICLKCLQEQSPRSWKHWRTLLVGPGLVPGCARSGPCCGRQPQVGVFGEVFCGFQLQGDFLDAFDLRFLNDFQNVSTASLNGWNQRSMTIA